VSKQKQQVSLSDLAKVNMTANSEQVSSIIQIEQEHSNNDSILQHLDTSNTMPEQQSFNISILELPKAPPTTLVKLPKP